MVLAMVEDIRVVLVKLAERTHALRCVGQGRGRRAQPRARCGAAGARDVRAAGQPPRRVADQVGDGGLGVPLSRARDLQAHRRSCSTKSAPTARRYIEGVIERAASRARGRTASRPKSAAGPSTSTASGNKMRRKRLDFEQLYDMRAVRVLVKHVIDCYAALGAGARPVAADPGRVRRLHRAAQEQRLPLAAHRGDRPGRQARSRCRSAPSTCTTTPSSASPRTGATRKAAARTRSTRRRSPGCGACWNGRTTSPTAANSPSSSRPNCSRTTSTC